MNEIEKITHKYYKKNYNTIEKSGIPIILIPVVVSVVMAVIVVYVIFDLSN